MRSVVGARVVEPCVQYANQESSGKYAGIVRGELASLAAVRTSVKHRAGERHSPTGRETLVRRLVLGRRVAVRRLATTLLYDILLDPLSKAVQKPARTSA